VRVCGTRSVRIELNPPRVEVRLFHLVRAKSSHLTLEFSCGRPAHQARCS
jgi:hypothetical protein